MLSLFFLFLFSGEKGLKQNSNKWWILITNDIQTLKITTFNLLSGSISHVMFESEGRKRERMELNYHINLSWANMQTLLLTQKTPLLERERRRQTVKIRHEIKMNINKHNFSFILFIWRETFHNVLKFNKSHVKIYQIIRTIYNMQRDLNGSWVWGCTGVVAWMLLSGVIYY